MKLSIKTQKQIERIVNEEWERANDDINLLITRIEDRIAKHTKAANTKESRHELYHTRVQVYADDLVLKLVHSR